MLKKLACFTGWLVVICLSLLFCFILGLWQNWGTPAILLFWLLLLLLAPLLWTLFVACLQVVRGQKGRRLLEKYRLSRREYLLLNHWKAGAGVIKSVQRKRNRLPWFLLVGERCGKSTLLASSGLPLFYGESDDAVPGPTRTLRWWFFRSLCVLDLSSNFLNGAATFRQGWGKLAQWCTKMPAPAGIIITLSISDLMSEDSGLLHAAARKQRALIEPLIQRFGDRLPLTMMVTQCDRFPGFSLWQQQLSASQRQQPLGYRWGAPPHIDGEDPRALQPLFDSLKQGFALVRLSMARPLQLSAQDYLALLDFPESFARLEQPLRCFLASLCEPNAYFSHAQLSSVWFSAAEPQADNRGRRVSVFTHGLLTEGLPALSQQHAGLCGYHRRRGNTLYGVVLAACVGWLGSAALQTAGRLQRDIAHMPPDALVAFLEKDEQQSTTSLFTLPFAPILQRQQAHASAQLAQIAATPRPLPQTFNEYQQRTLAMAPAQQRESILRLANALLVWQAMRDRATLHALQPLPAVAEELRQDSYPATLSSPTRLALERYHMQRPEGERWLRAARQLLVTLVNHDPSLLWLQAPAAQLPPVSLATWWPSLPEDVALSGVWTHQGEATLAAWMAQIEHAAGGPQPVFQHAREQRLAMKQNAWRQFVIGASAALARTTLPSLTHSQLVAMSQNQSQAMQFADRAIEELSDIPASHAQPWLTTLRHLQQLASASDSAALLNKAARVDSRIRQSVTAWLRGKPVVASVDTTQPVQRAWLQWQKVRNEAVNDAISQGKNSDRLTRGLLTSPEEGGEPNPLAGLTPALTTLREHLSGAANDADTAAVWSLYQEDAHRLLAYAMTQSACWLNDQWKSLVIWPLGKDAEQRSYEEQQALSQQSVMDFLRGPAKAMLAATHNGPDAAAYAGMKVPLTADFLRLARQVITPEMLQDVPQRGSTQEGDKRAALQAKVGALVLQLAELEKKKWKSVIASMPATVPGGARVIPTGTQLTLHCQQGDQQLNSMNFADKAEFVWQPGACYGVTLGVLFPDFTAHYQLSGDDAWPIFIDRLLTGETLFDSEDFDDDAVLLSQLGIKQILVRFSVANAQSVEEAWQSWRDLTEQVASINAQIASMDERIQQQQSATSLAEPISALPGNIAQCR